MAATFRSVNKNALLSPASSRKGENEETIASPTTPKPSARTMVSVQTPPPPPPPPSQSLDQPTHAHDDATTPTRASFPSNALASQKPLPTSPFPESVQVPEAAETAEKKTPKRENSQHSRHSKDSDDMDMDDEDGEGAGGEEAGSDDESVTAADGSRSKKKSQRFFCTDYPPCNLSFTRSEHLARHIRKHTGERPFQCHCSRRFSRLDNLRQHAQTVHVNEDIPIDSLAATGTRFQRQIRTDRVRQAGGRSRASTGGSGGGPGGGRGHAKSLSTSSIASASSMGSAYSANEARRRPPPLVMADPRSRLSIESYRSADGGPLYRPASPSDFSTPTSATFSTGHSSPRWGSGVASPISSHSRSHSLYAAGSRTPGRRLSVPSGGNPFHSPHGVSVRGPVFGPGTAVNASNSGAFSPAAGQPGGQPGLLASPTVSNSTWLRRDSMSSAADEAWRRRTWHPDTRDYNGASRLSQVISSSRFPTGTIPPPVASPTHQAHQPLRLPGIESFDPLPRRPLSPPRRNPSPMMIDSDMPSQPPPPPHPMIAVAEFPSEDRRTTNNNQQWDNSSLHRGLTRLDINTPPRDSAGAWANEVHQAVLARVEQARVNQPQPQQSVRFDTEVKTMPMPMAQAAMLPISSEPPPPPMSSRHHHHHTMSAPSITTSREAKRHGWYNGPAETLHPARETIPEGRLHVERIVHPNVARFQGFPAREQQQQQQQPIIHQQTLSSPGGDRDRDRQSGNADSLRRLEALVAVATSEGSTATAY